MWPSMICHWLPPLSCFFPDMAFTTQFWYAMTMLLFFDLAKHLLLAELFSFPGSYRHGHLPQFSRSLLQLLTSLVLSHPLVPPPSRLKRGPQLFSVPWSWFLPLALTYLDLSYYSECQLHDNLWAFFGYLVPFTCLEGDSSISFDEIWRSGSTFTVWRTFTAHLLDSVTSAYDSFQLFWDDSPYAYFRAFFSIYIWFTISHWWFAFPRNLSLPQATCPFPNICLNKWGSVYLINWYATQVDVQDVTFFKVGYINYQGRQASPSMEHQNNAFSRFHSLSLEI